MRKTFAWLACGLLTVQHASGVPNLVSRDAPFAQVRTKLNRSHQKYDKHAYGKYFHESSFDNHYDGRFAAKPLQYDERRHHLTALVQTYLSSMHDIGAETFIMHGTLLGWWWNRKSLPWDSDIDVMVSEKSMRYLADHYNMTVHRYRLPGIDAARDYMFEMNSHCLNDSIDKVNMIDARWIDTDTGLYIDITTLRRNHTAEALGDLGAMMVKDGHHYHHDEIFPLRESTFEGVPVKIPYAYAQILIEDYEEQALSGLVWANHRFDQEKQEWVPVRDVNGQGGSVSTEGRGKSHRDSR
ncbi:putative mannosylphosphorylation protein [Teratosphaeria destructans]|uniref:Mannosylphosphorylation protein n=1 Tax=Teratosphaeria destructans TaxID=418781 RepID=A0A9W7SXI6_9PEZI|nr:putative mannosylphosphorylation protein [Teratosphaeria destructans]